MSDGSIVRTPLVGKLSRLVDLDPHELALLAALERRETTVEAKTDIHRRGDPFQSLHVVRAGWLYSHCTAPGGRGQILRLHFPGDILGMPDRVLGHAPTALRAATDARLCPFPAEALDAILTGAPRLGALLFAITLREQAELADRIRATGKTAARERLAFFLLDIFYRLRAVDPAMADTFTLPLRQGEIGDATALTNVTISKTLMAFQLDKLIGRREGTVTLLRIDALAALCGFEDRSDAMDVSWLPGPG